MQRDCMAAWGLGYTYARLELDSHDVHEFSGWWVLPDGLKNWPGSGHSCNCTYNPASCQWLGQLRSLWEASISSAVLDSLYRGHEHLSSRSGYTSIMLIVTMIVYVANSSFILILRWLSLQYGAICKECPLLWLKYTLLVMDESPPMREHHLTSPLSTTLDAITRHQENHQSIPDCTWRWLTFHRCTSYNHLITSFSLCSIAARNGLRCIKEADTCPSSIFQKYLLILIGTTCCQCPDNCYVLPTWWILPVIRASVEAGFW